MESTTIPLEMHPGYSITVNEPFVVMGKRNRPLKTHLERSGYVTVWMNGDHFQLSRVIAEQFIVNPDPEHKTQVDHRDQNPLNNSLSNLVWVTPKENNENRRPPRRNPAIWDDNDEGFVVPITEYNGFQFTDYYFDGEKVIVPSRSPHHKFRELVVNKNRAVQMTDNDGHVHAFGIGKLYRHFRELMELSDEE